MKLDGIHHITAITADAQRNVDFYVGVLGLRLVKKSVNQDDPTVYHLFYGDEDAHPGLDLTFFEYPGAAPGRAGDGMIHRVVWRVAGPAAIDFWADRLGERRHRDRAQRRQPAVRRPRGARPRAAGGRRERRAADRRAPRDPRRARAPGLPRRARVLLAARRERAAARDARLHPRRGALGGARRQPRLPPASTTSRPPGAASRARARSTTWPGPPTTRTTRPGASESRRAAGTPRR